MLGTWTELRVAARQLRRYPVLASVAVLTLALGLGATTAIFSVLYAVILRPLPYADSDRMPVNPDSLAELRRGLASLANREAQRQYVETLVREANVNLLPAAAWLLVRLEQDPATDPTALGRTHAISASTIDAAVDQLSSRGLVTVRTMADNWSRRLAVTRAGCDVLGRIITVRRAHLADAAAEWDTDEMSAATLRDDERELVPDARPTAD